jgi:hypothetical protein
MYDKLGRMPAHSTLEYLTYINFATMRLISHYQQFEKYTITVPLRDKDYSYDVHGRPLWDWALDLIRDPRLAPYFVWDAQRLYKYNGNSFVRFINEPWTANRFWEIQVSVGS